mmetsp:Transcript_90259/g.165282  ORF Transcript_90259/g.165282 Transcript_90259/m.165282 type:complete len:273 (-) Transcript_90259:48-866(-)
MMKLMIVCLAMTPAVTADSVERNLVLDNTQQGRLRGKLAMQHLHEDAGELQHLYADEALGKGASRLEVLEVRNELEEARKEIRYQTNMLKGVMEEVNDLESDYKRRFSLLSKSREPAIPVDAAPSASYLETQEVEEEECDDIEPPYEWDNPTCEAQLSNTEQCEKRRTGELNDMYCRYTCGLCKYSASQKREETAESGHKVRHSHDKPSGKTKLLEHAKSADAASAKKKSKSGSSTKKAHSAKTKHKSHSGSTEAAQLSVLVVLFSATFALL